VSASAFRIFVSSTFADLAAEREALRRTVFPQLEAVCRRHGIGFTAVDLRWGVSEDAARDQRTVEVCLEEVDRCLEQSSPAVIVLLGDRYGWRPLPDRLPAPVFEAVQEALEPADRDELGGWYQRDDNADPPEYRLRPRDAGIPDCEWTKLERRLRRWLVTGGAAAGLAEDERRLMEASATEREIRRALDRDDLYCYFRSIEDMPRDGSAGPFTDHDEEARAALDRLKGELRTRHQPRVRDYRAGWTGEGPTLDHLDQLCQDVLDDLMSAMRPTLDAGPADEAEQHAAFGEARSREFVGRTGPLQRLVAYVGVRPEATPFGVVGPPGSGKSTLLGRLARSLGAVAPTAQPVVRFIGATAGSTTGAGLLGGLCRQIARAYGADETAVPVAYPDLAQDLPSRLALATADRPLVVIVDGLDQLGDTDEARDMAWLPLTLPEHAHVVVSATEAFRPALSSFIPGSHLLALGALEEGDADELLERRLGEARRTLQPDQRRVVLDAFRHTGLPLHLELLADTARRWTSDTRATPLPADVRGVVQALFARLAEPAEHGEVMVRRSLGSLTAAKYGLSEGELLAVLSADDTVMTSFRERSPRSPPVDALPPIVWARLRADLGLYVTERGADGTTLLGFHHRELADVADERFLTGGERLGRHRALAAFFASQELALDGGQANLRKLSEQPYQQTLGELWAEAFTTLTDFAFVEAKITHAAVHASRDASGRTRTRHGGVHVLEEDYRRALAAWPQ
jgi:hypothetical protein